MAKEALSETKIRLLFLGVFTLFLAIAAYFIFQKQEQTPGGLVPDPTATLQALEADLGVKADIQDTSYVNWKSADGVQLPLTGKQIILGTSGVNGLGQYGDIKDNDISQVTGEFLSPLLTKIREFYLENGFVESKQNTNSTPNMLWYTSLGFEKDGLYCVSNVAQQSDPFAYLSCGTVDNDQLALQGEFQSVYEEAKAQEMGDAGVLLGFRVSKVVGSFASGNVYSLGGYQWIAQKTDGSWKMIWSGNDMPLCSDMEKYSVPTTMYPSCYDPDSETTISSPDYVQN